VLLFLPLFLLYRCPYSCSIAAPIAAPIPALSLPLSLPLPLPLSLPYSCRYPARNPRTSVFALAALPLPRGCRARSPVPARQRGCPEQGVSVPGSRRAGRGCRQGGLLAASGAEVTSVYPWKKQNASMSASFSTGK
ncbi:hypothetical protein Nmel_010238, partial [Mimus melanotis]